MNLVTEPERPNDVVAICGVVRRAFHHSAATLAERCLQAGLRVEVAEPDRGTLGAGIRAHRLVPYQPVLGPREVVGDTVSLRLRSRTTSTRPPAQAH